MESGQTLNKGRYSLTQELGRGQRVDVWQAHDNTDGVEVAIKMLAGRYALDKKARKAFAEGVESVQGIRHPNLIEVFDVQVGDGTAYLVMELVSFGSLADFTKIEGVLPPQWASQILGDLLRGLAEAHDQGIVHGDIKPQNILLTEEGVPKLADLGIASILSKDSPYCAPNPKDPSGDIFGCALTLYNLVTGNPPGDLTGARRNDALKALPAPLAMVIKQGSAASADDRYASATEFRLALEDIHNTLDEEPLELVPPEKSAGPELMVFDGGPPPMDVDDPSYDGFDEDDEDEVTEDLEVERPAEEPSEPEGLIGRLEALPVPLWFTAVVGLSLLAVCGGMGMFMVSSVISAVSGGGEQEEVVEVVEEVVQEPAVEAPPPQPKPTTAVRVKKTHGSSKKGQSRSTGTLAVSAMPTSEVSVDGRRKGWDNWSGSVSTGSHMVKLRHGDGRTKTATVRVSRGQTTRYCWNFREEVECH